MCHTSVLFPKPFDYTTRGPGRYVESEAWKGFCDTGRMQFAEFGTPLPLVQGVGKLLLGITGLGQGMPHHLNLCF